MSNPALLRETSTDRSPRRDPAVTGGGSGAVQALKGQLRGQSFEDGERALAPVQRKKRGAVQREEVEYDEYGYTIGGKTPPKKGTYHERLLPGGDLHEQRLEEKYNTTAYTMTTFLTEVAVEAASLARDLAAAGSTLAGEATGAALETALPKGGTALLEASGKLTLPLFEAETKFNLDIKDAGSGKLEVTGKMEFGSALSGFSKFFSPFLPDIKAAFGGSYEVKAVGDSMNECMRLMQIGIELSMRNAAAEKEATKEQLQAMGEAQDDTSLLGALGGLLQWVWRGAKKIVNGIRKLPGNAAQWSLARVLNVIWVGDAGLPFDQRLVEAAKDMDETDAVEVTREGKGELSGEYAFGEEGAPVSGKVSGGYEHVNETKTTIGKDNITSGGTTEKSPKRVFKVGGELDLAKIGIKGKIEYENEKKPGDKHSTGELKVEPTVTMGLFQGAINVVATEIWARLSKWIEDSRKDPDAAAPPAGVSENAIAAGLTVGVQQAMNGIGRNAQDKPGKDVDVTATWTWKHSPEKPFHFASAEIKAMTKVAGKDGTILGMGASGEIKTGYKQTEENTNAPERKEPLWDGKTTSSMGSE